MKNDEVIKAWKDPGYRESLSATSGIPEHPAGWTSLDDDALKGVNGGLEEAELLARTADIMTLGCCTDLKNCEGASYKLGTIGCCTNNVTFIIC